MTLDVKCGLGATTNTKYISKARLAQARLVGLAFSRISFLGFSALGMPWHLGYDHFGLFGTYFHVLLMYSHICSPGGWPSFRAGNFMSNAQKKMSGDRLGPEISYL